MPRFLFALLLSLLVSHSVLAADAIVLRLHGSNTIGAHLAPELVKSWLDKKGFSGITAKPASAEEVTISARGENGQKIVVEISAHGSSTAFSGLDKGLADIGMASRRIKDKELSQLAGLGHMDTHQAEFVLGLDGIAVVVHPSNPLSQLTVEDLTRIFSGELTDWGQLGQAPKPIQVYARDDKSGTYDTFKSLVLGKSKLTPSALRYESNDELSDRVASDQGGIGFVGLPSVRESKALAIVGGDAAVSPNPFSVATEDYALARRLFLYVPERNGNPLAREFAEFAVSSAGQGIVEKVGFVSQRIIEGQVALVDGMPREYLELTRNARRLSLNFRFQSGSVVLDNKALRDLERLVAYAKRPENKNRKLMLFGFSDRNEVPLHGMLLSEHRADAVADLLLRRHVGPQRVRGFGNGFAVASNDNEAGRNKNRRVEVWIR